MGLPLNNVIILPQILMRVPIRRSEVLAQSKKQSDAFLTPQAIKRMQDEIVRLEKNDRPEAAEELRRCAAMGDLSDNAAYSYAKMQLRRINSRILSLQEKIKYAVPITIGSDDGRVRIGSTVTVETGGLQTTFEILGSQETNPLRGRISYLSPFGAALVGHKVGDCVTVISQKGDVKYTIVAVV